jgi:hypothetical protein
MNCQVDIRTISILWCSFESEESWCFNDIGGGTTDLAILKMELFVIQQ